MTFPRQAYPRHYNIRQIFLFNCYGNWKFVHVPSVLDLSRVIQVKMAKIVGGKLLINCFVYVKSRRRGDRVYWDSIRVRDKECKAGAITAAAAAPEAQIIVLRGTAESNHMHPLNQEQCAAEEVMDRVERKAEDHDCVCLEKMKYVPFSAIYPFFDNLISKPPLYR